MRCSALSMSLDVVTHVLEHEGRCPYPPGYAEGSVYIGQRDSKPPALSYDAGQGKEQEADGHGDR